MIFGEQHHPNTSFQHRDRTLTSVQGSCDNLFQHVGGITETHLSVLFFLEQVYGYMTFKRFHWQGLLAEDFKGAGSKGQFGFRRDPVDPSSNETCRNTSGQNYQLESNHWQFLRPQLLHETVWLFASGPFVSPFYPNRQHSRKDLV